jgi:hypothetical protein
MDPTLQQAVATWAAATGEDRATAIDYLQSNLRAWQAVADLTVLNQQRIIVDQTPEGRALLLEWLQAIARLVPGLVAAGGANWRLDDAQLVAGGAGAAADDAYRRELRASNRSRRPADQGYRDQYARDAVVQRREAEVQRRDGKVGKAAKTYCGNIHEVAADALRASRDPNYVGLYGFRGLGTLAGCTRRGYFGGRRAAGGDAGGGDDGADGGDAGGGDDGADGGDAGGGGAPLAAAVGPRRSARLAGRVAAQTAAAANSARVPAGRSTRTFGRLPAV